MNNNISWWRVELGSDESEAAREAVDNGRLNQGAITSELENKLSEKLGVPYVTVTTSGSAALVISLLSCGVKPGDEVIVPNRTYIATAHAPLLLGARVRLADTLSDSPLLDPYQVESLITPKTKAIIAVHRNGRACDVDTLLSIANKHNLYLIEDSAQALFSKHKNRCLGSFGHFGCFSLGVTKLITSGQGGFVITNDKTFYDKLQLVRTHGVQSPLVERFESFGFNFRITDIQASIALRQLDRVPKKVDAHCKLYNRYLDHIKNFDSIKMVPVDVKSGALPLYIEVICPKRDQLVKFMLERNIDVRKAHPNLNASPHLSDKREFPNSSFYEQNLLTLPSGPDQNPADIKRTLEALSEFNNQQ